EGRGRPARKNINRLDIVRIQVCNATSIGSTVGNLIGACEVAIVKGYSIHDKQRLVVPEEGLISPDGYSRSTSRSSTGTEDIHTCNFALQASQRIRLRLH